MSRRVVLRLNVKELEDGKVDFFQYLETLEEGLAQARELGAGPRAKVRFKRHPDIGPVLVVELPASATAALERKERPPVLTKTQQAVRDRREARQAAIAAGEQVPGHEPPVVRKRLKKRKKA